MEMEMAGLRKKLSDMGFGLVPPERIRFCEEHGHIPQAARNWRGFRVFDDRHVEGMAAWLTKKQQPAKAGAA